MTLFVGLHLWEANLPPLVYPVSPKSAVERTYFCVIAAQAICTTKRRPHNAENSGNSTSVLDFRLRFSVLPVQSGTQIQSLASYLGGVRVFPANA